MSSLSPEVQMLDSSFSESMLSMMLSSYWDRMAENASCQHLRLLRTIQRGRVSIRSAFTHLQDIRTSFRD